MPDAQVPADPTRPSGGVAPAGSDAPTATAEGSGSGRAPRLPRRARRRARRKARLAGRSRLRRRLTRSGIGVGLLILAIVGAVVGFSLYQFSQIGRVNVKDLNKVATTGSAAGAENILLVGSTSRCAVQPAKNFANFVAQCENGVNGVNSDVIMVLRLVPGKMPTLLSIPRDTFVPDARAGDLSNKVDAALADGPAQLVQAIEEDFGIPINHYVVLNFQTFANIVTVLGGITMYFPTSLRDSDSGLYISHSGCLHISGLEALALVRARHLYYDYNKRTGQWEGYDPSGDIGRIERVHEFLKVLGTQVARQGLGNPITDERLLSAIAPDLTLDTTFSTSEILHLVSDYHGDISKLRDYTLPVIEDTQTYDYKGYDYGLIVFPTEPQDQDTIDAFMGRATPGATLRPSSITVSVQDATGSPADATTVASQLAADGYHASSVGAGLSVGPVSETMVEYSGAAHLADAERVMSSLGGTVVLAKVASTGPADVEIVTGTDLAVAPPATTTAATSRGVQGEPESLAAALASVTLTGTTASAANAALSAPTLATPGLAPYDPRACPARGSARSTTSTLKTASSKDTARS